MFDILRESLTFQKIMQVGWEEGMEEGLEKGLVQGHQEAQNYLIDWPEAAAKDK